MTAEEIIARELEGKFFHYIGKPVEMTALQIKQQREAALQRQKKLEEIARREREKELREKRISSEPEFKRILAVVAHVHAVTVDDLCARSREAKFAVARHHAIWELKTRKEFSTIKIGKILNRDHSTIVHSLDAWSKIGHLHADAVEAVRQILTTGSKDDEASLHSDCLGA